MLRYPILLHMDREIRYCTTEDGVRIGYYVAGNGKPTILALPAVHESFSLDHLMPAYQQFYRDLGAGRRVVRFDWRATGLSRAIPEGAQRRPRRLADVEAVAGALGDRFVLWASTAAGPTAIAFAAAHPDLVDHLILYDTYAVTSDALSAALIDGLRDLARANWEMATQTLADMNGRREFPDQAAELGEWFYRSASVEAFLESTELDYRRFLTDLEHGRVIRQSDKKIGMILQLESRTKRVEDSGECARPNLRRAARTRGKRGQTLRLAPLLLVFMATGSPDPWRHQRTESAQ